MSNLDEVRDDLRDEHDALNALLAGVDDAAWRAPTPSPGWTVGDQVGHLAFFDHAAALAITNPDQFTDHLGRMIAGAAEVGLDDFTLAPYRAMTPFELFADWRVQRSALDLVATTLSEGQRVPWYGPAMSATSFLGARVMETWAHGDRRRRRPGRRVPGHRAPAPRRPPGLPDPGVVLQGARPRRAPARPCAWT